MNCPVDGATLLISERSGVEIDYCPTCRGVWLDRGELDKIIDRMDDDDRAPRVESARPAYADPRHKRKRKRLFGEFFDFD